MASGLRRTHLWSYHEATFHVTTMRTEESAVTIRQKIAVLIAGATLGIAVAVRAQAPPAPPAAPAPAAGQGRAGRGGGGGGGGFANAFPQRETDPEAVSRGKALYALHCEHCHGADARGGAEGGVNLLQSTLMLEDQHGETITPLVQNGSDNGNMPNVNVTAAQIADIAEYVHSFRVAGYDASRARPVNILTGDATAGATYFAAKCGPCHSVSGDLRGIGGRIADPRTLQQFWLMPPAGGGGGRGAASNVPPTTATVTLASGQKVEGRLMRIDDFVVSLLLEDGSTRTFRRAGESPKVEVHDPLAPHKALLRVYSDKDIHDVTAYLVTIK
jgi:cytochrome c oxidase cbb3-type subunit III